MKDPTTKEILEALIDFKEVVIKKLDEIQSDAKETREIARGALDHAEGTRELLVDFRKDTEASFEILIKKSEDTEKLVQEYGEDIVGLKSDIVVIKSSVFAE